ncbi:FkbM family methyltransferase [Caldimonas tepidiphila]|uniref:FkbM family methyltransferase n=1 Tax=Caldimonas tepidiphila TaxID=2315841 RepID=UPI000E5ACFC2|nr:FkbM family methyltransferase [Caldimonas tepidiphila]
MRVAVVTPYYKEPRAWLQRCMDSVRRQSHACVHIVVADGHAQDWLDTESGVRHLRLDRAHGDYGNTPRALGALLAASEGFDAIAFLDGDNWYDPDHIASCVEAAASGADFVTSGRHIVREDGSVMKVNISDEESGSHVDTNCFFLLSGAFHTIARWLLMPKPMASLGDRFYFQSLRHEGLRQVRTGRRTVHYLCTWASIFRAAGEIPPPYAKESVSMRELLDWRSGLLPEDLDRVRRLTGCRLEHLLPQSRNTSHDARQASRAEAVSCVQKDVRIPRIFHRVWFGDKPIPEEYESWWAGWQRQYPDYEFRTWRDKDVAKLPLSAAKIAEAGTFAGKADVARYEILLIHGGVYIDCDMMPFRRYPFEAEDASLVVCNENGDPAYCSNSFIAAVAGHELMAEAVEALQSKPLNRQPPNVETGPAFFGQLLLRHPHKRLPTQAFYPYNFNEPFSSVYDRSLEATYGIHVWAGSWVDENHMRQKTIAALAAGDLRDAEAHAARCAPALRDQFIELVSSVRNARSQALKAVLHPLLQGKPKVANKAPFELVKVLDFLFRRQSDAVVWQVGAADGVLADPLRPAMIRHDPVAVLFEPNPMMFAKLEQNYARNDNARLVPAAVGTDTGKIVLHAVDPDLAREKGLPDWGGGVSSFSGDCSTIGGKALDSRLAGQIRQCLVQTEVLLLSVEDARRLSGVGDPSVLVVDVHGMDAEVILGCLDAGMAPSVIRFGPAWLTGNGASPLLQRLAGDYVILEVGGDALAYRQEFFGLYCETLYVDLGLPTVHAENLAFTMRI